MNSTEKETVTTGSSEVRIGIDLEIHTDDEEFVSQHYRVKRIERLEKCTKLKRVAIIASCVEEIEGLDSNDTLEELEIYQGLLREIKNVSHLSFLRVLDLSFNNIRRIENISTLRNLEKLYLSNNKIEVIEGLEGLSKLKVLELGSNRIKSVNAPCLAGLTDLEELWLGKNKIASLDTFPDSVSFPRLRQLSLQSNRLTAWSPALFTRIAPNVASVYLGSNQLPDMDEETRAALNPSTLEELDLSCNQITRIPHFPKQMLILEELWLNDNLINDTESFTALSRCYPSLRTIYIERNPVHTQCPLDCRNSILANSSSTLEQIDAGFVTRGELAVSSSHPHVQKSILRK